MGLFMTFGSRTKGKCKICRAPYEKKRAMQKVPDDHIDCAIELGRREKAKKDRVDTRERKSKAKPLSVIKDECQAAINALVREEEKDLPCISCGRFHEGQWHCGHYLSVGARANLRFERQNLAKQCQPCNVHLSGNLINYRIGLIKRIGLEAVEALES